MTIYTFSVITCSGYPFYFKELIKPPKNIDLHLRFFDLSNMESQNENFDKSFELFAGLISALFEFARLLNQDIELLKFKNYKESEKHPYGSEPRIIRNPLYPIEIPAGTDVLINCQNERFLNPIAIEAKIHMIFHNIISKKLPLGPDKFITKEDEKYIIRILTDQKAKARLKDKYTELKDEILKILKNYLNYGLQAVVITSFDYTPLLSFNITDEDLYFLLRNIGKLPDVQTYKWKYRMGYIKNKPVHLYIVNSGSGIMDENVFMPFYYLLICKPDAIMGETPQIIYEKLNKILE